MDAFPGEKFAGKIARLSPVLDPATRTAAMEVEVPNTQYRLKPGMYARVDLTVEDKANALVVPKIALVDSQGERGVYQPNDQGRAVFKPVKVGIENNETAEILTGLAEGEQIISTGAGALRRDDQVVIAGADGPSGTGRGRGRGNRPGGGAPGTNGSPNAGSAPKAPQDGSGVQGNPPAQQRQPGTEGFTRPDGQPRGGRGRGQGGESVEDGQNPAGRRPVQLQSVLLQRPIA